MISGRPNEPIAIIGSACRFAGDLNTPSKLWELLQEPHDIRQEVPPDRFSLRGFYHPDGTHHGHANVSHAYFINEDLTAFDAEFFSIKPAEAKAMDPQQRLLMEVVYEGLESAGIPMSQLHGSDTGVYVGVMFDDYGAQLLRDLQMVPTYYATGTSRAVLANRLSYFFDWRGPSISVDTACSSSLVAVHMAVQALRAGESRVALACGSNLILGPESFIIESKLNMLSPDGISRMWDEGANGYARGEGVAAVVLKTLSDAIQDGDHIECVIRETALNQNGRTAKGGITVPSASAQEDLIRTTYAKAGLDLDTPNDRPQYFEAHGTGTPAGDPLEAEAVYNTFIKGAPSVDGVASKNPLYVGSVKTVIGHTEGTAGIAALLKVSQSIQRGVISPNLHFDQLSHRVAPFYKGVEVLKTAVPWPDTAGVSRRASVNSFGFGGSNAHAILEQYVPAPDGLGDETAGSSSCIHDTSHTILSPFVFSASSESSLRQSLTAHMISLETSAHHFPLNNFAWTLRQRRSILSYRAAFSAHCAEDLQSKLRASLEISPTVGCKVLGTGRILGVFTGQGAQYKRMGAELIETSEFARKTIQQLDRYLADTPGNDGPAWSLETEILTSNTRVYGAEISQPVCTAIQILLVDLLRIGGIRFEAVVGHSSGEIAAAYAAGFMTARDAIQIAYYRGLHTRLSSSPNGSHIQGAMMAVASSVEDVVELCADKLFTDRITIAAYNSSSSVTVSGDVDAIEDLGFVLDDEKKYNRRLEVDKAYHSAHMSPCEEPYTESLRRCGIQPQAADRQSCAWYSSVYDRRIDTDISGTLRDSYWVDNMTKPVLFMQAISRALADYPCDIALEIGPHPALKGPASQTIQEVLERNIPYHGTLDRKMGSAEAVSTMMGFLWSNLPETKVDLQNWKNVMAGDQPQSYDLITNLPPYQWNHQTQYWHESRSSRRMRLREQAHHPLLGHPTTDSSPHHMCWRNLLRLNEMKWLRGHQVQGQVIFPAAGYVSSALEAGRLLTRESNQCIRLIEVKDFIIHQAVAFDHENAEIEVLISMGDIQRGPLRIQAQFTYSAALASHDAEDLTLAASGNLEILLGESDPSLLPVRKPTLPFLIDVETNRFYAALADLGYEFGDRFCSLSGLMRKRNRSTCLARLHPPDYGEEGLLIHPTELDATLQSVILAHSYPYDEQLRTLHLPTKISHIRVNPALCSVRNRRHGETASMDASIEPGQPGQRGVTGFVDLYFNHSPHAAIQIQGANFMPLGRASTEKDRKVFSKVHWINSKPNGLEAAKDIILTETHRETVRLLERISTFYLRQFDREVPHDHPKRSEYPTNCYLNYARYVTEMVETGRHTWAEEEWRYDTIDRIMELSKPFSHLPDVEIMHLVGSQMPRVFGGKTTMLEEFRADGNDILDRYYSSGFGLKESAQWVARSVKQIVDRYPHMNILEAGAGTGGATKAIFKDIDRSFRSYTYTDISAGFFNNASSIFSKQRDQMVFKTFDAERSPADQGFVEGSYDLVIAFFIIHATKDLECTMRNIRKLLKPGGYLVVGEGQEGIKCIASSGFIFGTLPGWWLGTQNGRILSPHVSPERWDELLKDTGFSGTDSTSPKDMQDTLNVFHFVAQAVDEPVKFLRTPLAPSSWQIPPIEKLVLVGGGTTIISAFVDKLKGTLKNTRYVAEVFQFETLMDVDYEMIDSHTMVVSLTELDKPMFKDITEDSFESLKKMFESEKTLLWITSGRLDDEPYSNMTVGFGRTASNEVADLRLQQLDITDLEFTSPELLAEIILRFYGSGFLPIDVLWTVEPEIVIDNEQRQLLSRLRPIQEMNDRYNSGHRPVVRETSSKNAHFSLQSSPSGYSIVELSNDDNQMLDQGCADLLVLRTMHSVLSAIKTRLGHKFLILGEDLKTSERYLALTASLDSVTRVPRGAAVACSQLDDISNEELITSAASHVVVMAGFHDLYHGQTVIAHNATKVMADALAIQAAANNIDVVYTTDIADEELPDNWLKLPQYLTGADAKEILSLWEPSGFLGFSNEDSQGSANEVTMISVIQHSCQNIQMAKSMYSLVGQISSSSDNGLLAQTLRQCLAFVKLHLKYGVHHQPTSTPSITLGALVRNPPPVVDNFSIIDWVSDTSLPLQVARLDSKPIFKGISGTYWIVGMSGALGISLIDWMVSRGAKYVVLSSRAPMVAPEWITAHARKGAKVIVMPCDITDESALKSAHQRICETLPPIRGVMNGAMVLSDTSIRNMDFSQLSKVIKPKVDGSLHLDRIFWEIDLDFLVLVSSINCVIGNPGQANYAAANTFMCSLAAQRRKRGFRAATVNAGAIIGAGYMQRDRRALDHIVERLHMMRLSEEDWCQAISEAIDASRFESPHGLEITTGLADVPHDVLSPPYWFSNPKFAAFIIHKNVITNGDNLEKASVSTLDLLQTSQSQKDVIKAVQGAFAAELRKILQVRTSDEDLMAARSSEIGLDSLVSVDIRSWFLKSLRVSIPVLRIMANDTISALVLYVVENLRQELTPQLSGNSAFGEDSIESLPSSPTDTVSPTHRIYSATTTPSEPVDTTDGFKREGAAYINGNIDWHVESRPPEDYCSIEGSESPSSANMPPRVIVLTGASGLLGHHLLERLLARPGVKKIVCLAIRRLPLRLERNELPQHPHAVYYEGDLSHPLLGLSAEQADSIFKEADVVIHNGADTSHLKLYADLRVTNVGSTVALTRLCLPRRIPIHYVSSAGVAMLYHDPGCFPPVSVMGPKSSLPAPDGTFGYMCSKWVNERLLEHVHEQHGLPVYIHRPSTIIREGKDATTAKAQLDWVNALLHSARKMQAVPRVEHNCGALDLVYVDSACADVLDHVFATIVNSTVTYVHEVGSVVIPLHQLQDIDKGKGLTFEILPLDQWISRAVASGLHPAVAALIEAMDVPGAAPYPRLLRTLPG